MLPKRVFARRGLITGVSQKLSGGGSMLIPVESKQIAFCSYDENDSTLRLYYHTGQVVDCPSVKKSEYESVLESPNRYDALIKVAQKGAAVPAASAAGTETGDASWQDT
jgi:hypothetical protein